MELQNRALKRRLVTFGIFSPRHWTFFRPDRRIDRRVYSALKRFGFRETIWQFVYRGQLGGLILPVNNGHHEIHVRFYPDAIEAEFEVGRRFLDHFLQPRGRAEGLVINILRDQMTPKEFAAVQCFFNRADVGQNPPDLVCRPAVPFMGLASSALVAIGALVMAGVLPGVVVIVAAAFAGFLYKTLPS